MKRPFHNDASQADRLATLENDRRVHKNTNLAHTDSGGGGGRFDAINRSTVIGTSPVPEYSAGPNWSDDPTGIEPPFPIDIGPAAVVGEAHEIEKSLREMSGGEGMNSDQPPPDSANDGGRAPLDASRRPRRLSKRG